MTRSPDGRSRVIILVRGNCSAIKGEMLDLKAPVPMPIMIKPITKQARELLEWTMTVGIAETVRMMWPVMAMASAQQIVLYRPRYASATHAPKRGIT